MSGSGLASNSQEDEDLLILRNSMGPGGVAGGAVDAEQSLVQEEVVLLPNSNTLVLPLADRGVLMGLMVVEGPKEASSSSTGSSWSYGTAEQLGDYASSSGSSSSSSSSSRTPGAVVGLSEEQLRCLRGAVPMLSRACALDLRCGWEALAAAAHQARAASLLLEVRGPLRAISTFGRMLMPRLPEGEPDRDMASAIMLQEQRLQEVVAQLEAALRPAAAAPAGIWQQLESLGGGGPSALEARGLLVQGYRESYGELEGLTGQEHKKLLPGGREEGDKGGSSSSSGGTEQQHAAAVGDPWDLHREGGGGTAQILEEDTPVTCPPAAAAAAGSLPSSPASLPTAAPDAVWPPELPDALRSSQRDIRWRPAKAPSADAATTGRQDPGDKSSAGQQQVGEGGATPAEAAAAHQQHSSHKVVVTAVPPSSPLNSPGGAARREPLADSSLEDDVGWVAGAGSAGGFTSSRSQAHLASSSSSVPKHASASTSPSPSSFPPSCNLVEVLSNVLRAAGRLAELQGVTLIVNHPLQQPADHKQHSSKAKGSPSTGTSSSGGGVGVTASASSSPNSSSSSSELLPRPVPPLLVAVRGGVISRALGYVLDVALQCTPRGGQLCVTARQCSGGVELCVLHTGQLQPSRLHPSSRDMTAALPPLRRARRAWDNGTAAAGGARGVVAEIVEGASLSGVGGGQGSGLVSLEFARQVIQRAGGRVSVVYPCHFMNAQSGQLELGTSVEVWLPRAEP